MSNLVTEEVKMMFLMFAVCFAAKVTVICVGNRKATAGGALR